jgi:hypothetical protein
MRDAVLTERETTTVRQRILPSLAVVLVLLICKGVLYGAILLTAIGLTVDISPGPWAIMVDLAVAFAIVAFLINRRRHGEDWPMMLAVVGAALVIGRMHGPVPAALEWVGLVLLVCAAYYDWRAGKRLKA